MYTSLLARQQFKIIAGLWQNQQLQLLTACIKNAAAPTGATKSYAATNYRPQNIGNPLHPNKLSTNRLYCHEEQKRSKIGTQLEINIMKDENVDEDFYSLAQNFNLKQLLYKEEDDIMGKLNSSDNLEQ